LKPRPRRPEKLGESPSALVVVVHDLTSTSMAPVETGTRDTRMSFQLAAHVGTSERGGMKRAVVGAALCVLLLGCDLRRSVGRLAVVSTSPYFVGPESRGWSLDRLGPATWSFRWTWYRNLVVMTSEGAVVIDPMSVQAATALRAELDKRLGERRIAAVVYSHFHLDHVEGARALAPARVIAHSGCADYWQWLDTRDVLPPTETVDGDAVLDVGGVRIELLYLPRSHTNTMLATYVPSERVLYAPDLALVRTIPPLGYPDANLRGNIAACERLSGLDFDHYVAGHFELGNKRDFREAAGFTRDLVAQAAAAKGRFGNVYTPETLRAYFDFMYAPLQAKYQHWRGFDEMTLLAILRALSGAELGY
jgi:glyoxylase-like metal-dependent hydrolase (beta-lactamase superfamily II)